MNLLAWLIIGVAIAASLRLVHLFNKYSNEKLVPILLGIFLAGAFGFTLYASLNEGLKEQLLSMPRPVIFFALFLPAIIAFMPLFFWKDYRDALVNIPKSNIAEIQIYRLIGSMFLILYFLGWNFTSHFAYPASIGDVIVGLGALPIANLLKTHAQNVWKWALSWNLFGILDLIVGSIMALVYGVGLMREFPFYIIALFLGPAFGTLLHFYSLYQLNSGKQ